MSEPTSAIPGETLPAGDGLTALISRLTGECYRGPGGFPSVASVPDAPVTLPLAGSASGLSTPPVHPTFDPLDHQPAPRAVSGKQDIAALDPGPGDTYAFGEPHRYFDRRDLEPRETSHSGPDYYFLNQTKGSSPRSAGKTPSGQTATSASSFDITGVRRDFPALHQKVNGHPLVWLDNAATTHKPQAVIDATSSFYSRDNSNIHRAAHTLAARSTGLFEAAREKVRRFLGASDAREIVFVRGTTEAINLVAQSYGKQNIGPGDEILLTTMEHHANIVPWQLLAQQVGATLRVAPINDSGELILDQFAALLGGRTKIVAITHVSNALGTVNPVEQVIAMAHAYGVPVLVDGAQSTPHMPVNVQALDADFYTLSGHKIFGPTGIGALYGKASLLEQMPPWQGGGHMIKDVTFAKTTFNSYPEKFEAGTPDIAGVVGLGAAVDYLMSIGLPAISAYEHALLEYATQALATVPGLRPIGTAAHKASVLSFVIPGVPNADIGKYLDRHGIAVRSGHHCAQPALRRFGVDSTVRPSLAFYNTREEVDLLVDTLHRLPKP